MEKYIANNTYNMELLRQKKHENASQKLLVGLLSVTLGIYLFTPVEGPVSMSLFYVCFGLMLLSNYIYFTAKKKSTYLDFDAIFIVVYCLVGFSTTFFYHDRALFNGIFLGFSVDEEYINIGNLLFLIGLQSYMIGSLIPAPKFKTKWKLFVVNTNFLIVLILILIAVFILSGGVSHFKSEYDRSVVSEGAGIVRHVLLLLVASAMALIGIELYNKKIAPNYKVSRFTFTVLVLLVLILLWAGNRTAASQILLPIVCIYSLFFKKIGFKKFLVLAGVGIILMWFVQRFRTSEQSFELSNPIFLILDLTIPVRNTYAAVQYVVSNGVTYGSSMILEISAMIPFMPSFIADVFPELKSGSAEILTEYTFSNLHTPKEFQIGLGTTIIADLYLAFGLPGVLILMFFLGRSVNKWTQRSLALDYYSIIILSAMLGNAIFIVRAGYMHPLRFIVWALLLASFSRFLTRAWKR